MNFMWLIYWILLLISLIFSVYIIIKKNTLLGIIQIGLTLAFTIYTFIYAMNRDFVNGESEIEYIYKNLLNYEISAIVVVLLLVILIGIFIYNLFGLKKSRGGLLYERKIN